MSGSTAVKILLCLLVMANRALTQPEAGPRAAGQEAWTELQQYFHQAVDEGRLPGIAMAVCNGDQVKTDAYGMQYAEMGIPMQTNSIFRIASMTKPIVSTVAMMLYEEGRLGLDDPVSRYIPAFEKTYVFLPSEDGAAGRMEAMTPVTIRHLLMHTSGLSAAGFGGPPFDEMYRQLFTPPPVSLEDMADRLAKAPFLHQPGEGWSYGHSIDVVGRVIEVITGKPLDQVLEERITGPLDMKDTGFTVPANKINRFAAGYGIDGEGKWVLQDAPGESRYVKGPVFPRGNGGLVSTLHDYLRFAAMMANGGELDGRRYLRRETVALMMENHLPDELVPIKVGKVTMNGQGFGIGFGVLVEDTPYGGMKGDCFWPGAYFTYFFINPHTGTAGVFMCQHSDLSRLKYLFDFHGMANRVFPAVIGK